VLLGFSPYLYCRFMAKLPDFLSSGKRRVAHILVTAGCFAWCAPRYFHFEVLQPDPVPCVQTAHASARPVRHAPALMAAPFVQAAFSWPRAQCAGLAIEP
jgi:hypothetical protein